MSVLLAVIAAVLLGTAPASAQVSAPSASVVSDAPARITPQVQAAPPAVREQARQAFRGDDLDGKDGPMAKVGRVLATLYYQHEAKGPAGVQRLLGEQTHQGPRARYYTPVSADGRFVTVHAIAAEERGLRADLRALGLRDGATTGTVVSGRLPISSLKDAAQLSSLRGMTLAYAQTHVGSVGSEADTSHRAYQGRNDLNVDGSGEKVCALSDSYDTANASTSASDDVQSGDLPGSENPDGRTTSVDVLDDYDGPNPSPTDEGRAMLQLIHDIAPGAELGFHTAFDGLGDFVNGIRDLADPAKGNCTIIVDDIRYNIEPFYQDGPVTNVADSVASEGIPYFSSAGNDGQNSYEAPFRNSGNSGVISGSSVAHDFNPSDSAVDTLQEITIRQGGTFRIFTLQWTDPSAVVDGSAGADTDIDVAIVNDTLGIVSQSARNSDVVDGIGVPFEGVLEHTNNGSIDANEDGAADSTFHVVIEKAAGPDPDEVKYIYSGRNFDVKEYDTLGPTIYGHPMAENAMAVAAAPFYNTKAFNDNADPAVLESFSSQGGIPILFDQTGTPYVSPQTREKPDVTGTDGIDNTFFGFDIGASDPDSHPNFFGTSAAAPNVAAIAALIQEANPGFAPADVYSQLESSAEDVTVRQTRDGGFETVASGVDPWSGHGFAKATAAALPVELARFDATLQEKTVVLTWKTASETKNAGFAVQHKKGDGRFETIAYRDGGGTTRESRTYRYQTAALAPGTHTFRLRQEDLDGSTAYSEELTVERTLSGRYSVSPVSPNPVSNAGTATVTVRAAQEVRVGVYNVLGQRVALLHDGPIAANDPTTLRMGTDLQSGVYFLRVDGETFSATRKFVRVR